MKTQTLKVGKETGSLVNYIYGNNATEPIVGKGATVNLWTDRHAYEVISVSADGLTAVIQQYNPTIVSGNQYDGSAVYEYKELQPYPQTIYYRKNGWYTKEVWHEFINREISIGEMENHPEWYDDNAWLKLIPGVTKKRFKHHKISIVFGIKDEHYDPSF